LKKLFVIILIDKMNGCILILLLFKATRCCNAIVGNYTYDLSSLETEGTNGLITVTPPAGDTDHTYEASFCEDKATCLNYLKGNIVRKKHNSDTNCEVYGKWGLKQRTEKTENGYQAQFEGITPCSSQFSGTDTSVFNFLCDPNARTLGRIQANYGSNECEIIVDVHTNLVCEGSTPVPSGGGGSDTGALSGGSIFLISLVVIIFIYIFGGFGLNYYKKEVIAAPNRTFWCNKLPFWTKTGCITSWIFALSISMSAYHWCCVRIFKASPEDDKMATGLIEESDD